MTIFNINNVLFMEKPPQAAGSFEYRTIAAITSFGIERPPTVGFRQVASSGLLEAAVQLDVL